MEASLRGGDLQQDDMKAAKSKEPEFSIITICRNEVRGIAPTCQSIVTQKHANFEWIVVDGASTDGTLEVLEQYRGHITNFVSERDKGIYDAMNKGIRLSRGKYVVFMNGGDRFSGPDVLNLVSRAPKAKLIYGQLELDEKGGVLLSQPEKIGREYLLTHMVHHQAAFFHQSLFKKHGLYNAQYRIAGDYDFFIRILANDPVSHHYIARPFAVFDRNGISCSEHHRHLRKRENHQIRMKHFPEYRRSAKALRQIIRQFFRESFFRGS